MKILIVDDDATCSFMYKLMLGKFGECNVVTNGFEAIEAYKRSLASNSPYNLILMDIMMPGMNGNETLKEIRLYEDNLNIIFPDNIKIILTTALDDIENQKIGEKLNPLTEAYIVKSAYPDALIEKMHEFGFILD